MWSPPLAYSFSLHHFEQQKEKEKTIQISSLNVFQVAKNKLHQTNIFLLQASFGLGSKPLMKTIGYNITDKFCLFFYVEYTSTGWFYQSCCAKEYCSLIG